ncbi:MAG: hypothetical protein Q4C13_08360 [Clostridia bacterium]|nr:hypothetical protein [Clostridia bacterium]
MARALGGKLAGKTDRTEEEQDMLELLEKGGSRVRPENLAALLDWYGAEKRRD